MIVYCAGAYNAHITQFVAVRLESTFWVVRVWFANLCRVLVVFQPSSSSSFPARQFPDLLY